MARRARICMHGAQITLPDHLLQLGILLACTLTRLILNRRSAAVPVKPNAAACALALVHCNPLIVRRDECPGRLFRLTQNGSGTRSMCVFYGNPSDFRLAIAKIFDLKIATW